MVKLYESGKPRADIIREYDLTASAFDKWVKQSQTSGSFKEKDNRTPEEAELIKLRKENQRLMMENDILAELTGFPVNSALFYLITIMTFSI